MINFKIKNDGKSTVAMTDDASDIYPKIADTDYTVSAFWSTDEGKPFDRTITQSDKLEVPSPSVFSETGATTTFYCKGLNSLIDNCWASARSGPLFWRIHIVYGVPKVARMPEDGIAAAYQLIADHLAKQAPKL
jgi:hypothetical protein